MIVISLSVNCLCTSFVIVLFSSVYIPVAGAHAALRARFYGILSTRSNSAK